VKALEVERDALRRQLGDGTSSAGQALPPAEVATETDAAPAEPEAGPAADAPAADLEEAAQPDDEVSARLVATRLALEGADREQIREKLESTYDLEDTDSLVDDVLERLA
jgi:hypothetical protein